MMIVAGVSATMAAKDIYAHDASVLPASARTTLANNFKAKVSVVKMDKDFGVISEYEAILTDGSEVSFDKKGNWKNVEVKMGSAVPAGFVPAAIRNHVKKVQPGQQIVGIEKKRGGYEVDLSNGVEMKYNRKGEFIRYDD